MMNDGRERSVCLGAIAGAHGVKGEVRLKTFTDEPLGIGAYGVLFDETGGRRFEIVHLRLAKNGVIAGISGIGDRTAAQALKGTRLYAPRAALPALDKEETWYQVDLIGLEVVNRDGVRLGEVAAILNFGAGDLVEIKPDVAGETMLVPFTKQAVPVVDIAAGRIQVDLERI